ncbi:MAG: hybrid sensor histidine kinase/response regulator [Melioribacteraceae bacterium]|nr:hybrid sensor histidine kinase/response regulator [Melioribacteraceae bacterium]
MLNNSSENPVVLIVDDEGDNIGILYNFLENQKFKVLVSHSGENCLTLLEKSIPDLILLDIRLPDIDGFEVCRKIKLNEQTENIPIIFMSALSDTDSKIRGFEVGGVDYISKPFHREEVLARINAHLTIKSQQKILRDLNASKDRLFSILSHDLRSPFMSLNGFSELLVSSVDNFTKDEIKEIADKILLTGQNTFRLLEDILKWANLQKNNIKLELEKFNLSENIDSLFILFKEHAANKKIKLINNVDKNAVFYSDKNALSTVLRNLLSNAIKFSYSNSNILIDLERNEKFLKLSVTDSGVGIPEADIIKLFRIDEIVTREGTYGESGTGLGLIICKDLVEKMGGKIWAVSEDNKGSVFSIIIPNKNIA